MKLKSYLCLLFLAVFICSCEWLLSQTTGSPIIGWGGTSATWPLSTGNADGTMTVGSNATVMVNTVIGQTGITNTGGVFSGSLTNLNGSFGVNSNGYITGNGAGITNIQFQEIL